MGTKKLIGSIAMTILLGTAHESSVAAQEYVKPDFMVSDVTDYYYKLPQLSVSKAGDMVVVWETTGAGDIWFKTIASLGEQISEQQLVETPNSTMETRVAHADTGNFMVMYGGYAAVGWSVIGQVYDRNGQVIGDTFTIDHSTTEMIQTSHATLSADRNNQFAVLLPGIDSMVVEIISGTGAFVGNTTVLKPGGTIPTLLTGIMTWSGENVMVWLDGASGEIYGLRYTSDGIPIGEEFQVSRKDENSILQDIALSSDTSGNFVVAWTSNSNQQETDIYSQLFNAEGIAVGSNTKITDEQISIENINGRISVDMDLDGKFVVAWSDTRVIDTSYIYVQQVDHTGERVGGNYRATSINNEIESVSSLPLQVEPCVQILRDTIFLTWVNYNQDLHYRHSIFANIQKWVPDVTGLDHQIYSPVNSTIYPNPTTGLFSLMMDHEYSGRLEMEVFNTAGVLVKRVTRSGSGMEETIDLSDLPMGTYYLSVKGVDFISTTPLVIIK
ncbi:MAG: T9SS type A sorting domain-containing protein [Bacteroidota bacterium]